MYYSYELKGSVSCGQSECLADIQLQLYICLVKSLDDSQLLMAALLFPLTAISGYLLPRTLLPCC